MDIKAAGTLGAVPQPSEPRAIPAMPQVPKPAPTPDELNEAVEALQSAVAGNATNLKFSVDSGRTVVTVLDTETNEIIRQMPTKEVMEIWRALDRMQGMLLNGKA